MLSSTPSPGTVLEKVKETTSYPEARVIVLDDEINTFSHVVKCLCKVLPAMNEDRALKLANKIDSEGAAEVWSGPLEQAELYHQQLGALGLTMAPLERT
tara:strand:+ start:3578 stop:3874 length:297 start_codon:yes stop_codon:yes gene_type:complete